MYIEFRLLLKMEQQFLILIKALSSILSVLFHFVTLFFFYYLSILKVNLLLKY